MRNVITPQIFNLTLTNADAEYSLQLPENCSRFTVQARANDVRMAYAPGMVADGMKTFKTIKAAQPPYRHDDTSTNRTNPRTLYFASGTGGAVVEVETWA